MCAEIYLKVLIITKTMKDFVTVCAHTSDKYCKSAGSCTSSRSEIRLNACKQNVCDDITDTKHE